MKKKGRYWIRPAVVLAGVLLMLTAGVLMTGRAVREYRNLLLTSEDSHLLALAGSVDRSMEHFLEQCRDELNDSVEQKSLAQAERDWLEKDQEMAFLHELENTPAARHENAADFLVLFQDRIRLSMSGSVEYVFAAKEGEVYGNVTMYPCLDSEGKVYMALMRKKENGVSYALLVDLQELVQETVGEPGSLLTGQILLMDAGKRMLLWETDGNITVTQTGRLKEEGIYTAMLSFLEQHQEMGEAATDFCNVGKNAEQSERIHARIAVLPVGVNKNGLFLVGVWEDFDVHVGTLRTAATWMLLNTGMVVLAIVLLGIWIARQQQKSIRVQQEAEALRRKNEAMEAINVQTQKLAHHQRLETIGTLTSSIAHEFNNMLTPIMGYSLMALEKLEPHQEEIYDDILEIYNTSRKAKVIISRLSDLARKNSSTVFKSLSPDELIRKTMDVIRPAKPDHVEIKLGLDCWDQRVSANEIQLSQLLMNLILNAFHAMEEKGSVLSVHTWLDEECIHICVEDDGCGISKEDLPRIFDPFFTTKETGKGTGLGLAIAAQVVEDHHGKIQVESRLGEGTQFTVSLPRFWSEEENNKS